MIKSILMTAIAVMLLTITMISCDGFLFDTETEIEYKRFVPRISGYVHGEVLGLYVMNEENIVVEANVIVTTDSGRIQTGKELYYKNNYSFFLYSPYVSDPDDMPVIGDKIDTIDPFVFFESLRNVVDQSRGILRVSLGKIISCYPRDVFFEMKNYPNNPQVPEGR